MLEKVKFKTWILLLHTSAISKSYSTYKKCQLGYEISTTVGQNWLLYVWLKSQVITGNQRKNLAKNVLLNYHS